MKISLNSFQGQLPVVADSRLPDNAAALCLNGRFEGGSLVPEREVSGYPGITLSAGAAAFQITDETTIQTALANNTPLTVSPSDDWLISAASDGDIVRGPLANDAYDRWYIAQQDAAPQVRYQHDGNTVSSDIGLDAPVFSGGQVYPTAPAFSTKIDSVDAGGYTRPTGAESGWEPNKVYSTYIVTQVSDYGEESKPCDPSNVFHRWEPDNRSSAATINLGTDLFNTPEIASINLYRSDGGGSFGFVGSMAREDYEYQIAEGGAIDGAAYFVDQVYSGELGEPNISADWDKPDPKMKALTNVGQGLLAGYFDSTVCFCEPYYPHAWPIEYQYNLADDKTRVEVRGIVSTSGFILVTTNAKPVLMYGSDPAAMSQQVVDIEAPNLARRGLVDMGDYALYPTHEGLMMVASGATRIVTKGVFSKDQWQALNPASFVAFRYHEDYLCFHGDRAFIYSADSGYFPIDPWANWGDVEVLDGYYNPASDAFWVLVQAGNTTRIAKFGAGELAQLRWQSKRFQIPNGINFSSARVEGESEIEFYLTGDGYSFHKTITDDLPFRLPPGRPRSLQLELRSRGRIDAVTVATSMQELYS